MSVETLRVRLRTDRLSAYGRDGTGLHGHPLDEEMVRVVVAEAAGTFVLVFSIIGVVVGSALGRPALAGASVSVTVPLAGGAALALGVVVFGRVSGAHFNPAVTIALAAIRRFPLRRVAPYIAAQLAGAATASLVVWWLYGPRARAIAHLGATLPAGGVNAWRLSGAEAVATFLLVVVVLTVASDTQGAAWGAGAPIGAALAVAIVVGGPVSGGGVNPARALAPMVAAGTFTDWWAYLCAPIAGAVLAAGAYAGLVAPRSSKRLH